MAVPIRRKIPPKAFQYTAIGILIFGGMLCAAGAIFIIALDGWNEGDGLIGIMTLIIVGFFSGTGYALKSTWEDRERIAREKGEKFPEEA